MAKELNISGKFDPNCFKKTATKDRTMPQVRFDEASAQELDAVLSHFNVNYPTLCRGLVHWLYVSEVKNKNAATSIAATKKFNGLNSSTNKIRK